jgi:hypothetical protein
MKTYLLVYEEEHSESKNILVLREKFGGVLSYPY